MTIPFICTVYATSAATMKFFSFDEKSKWEVISTNISCELRHIIPRYGQVRFIEQGGSANYVEIDVNYGRQQGDVEAKVDFLPPPWLPKLTYYSGFKFSFKASGVPIILDSEYANEILSALERGMVPTLTHTDTSFLHNSIVGQLSPIKFQAHFKKYLACVDKLPSVTYKQIERSIIYFESGSARITPEYKELLQNFVAYAIDPEIKRIELAGYSDSVGGYEANRQLARSRLESVKGYLVSLGIPPEKIMTTVFGVLSPSANNKSAAGRAKNRRVTIRLYR